MITAPLALLLAMQAATPPAHPAQRARANSGSLFSTADYPPDALRAHAQGRVSFHVEISAEGRVTNCEITGSSGRASLDAATCRILRTRARYHPARDAAGNPVPDTDNGWVAWRLPGYD
jgi:periplasmic protein TonB